MIRDLWIFPEPQNRRDKVHHLMGYKSCKGAEEYLSHSNDFSSYSERNTWRSLVANPIHFTTQKPTATFEFAGNAPLSFWAVIDLTNGSTYHEDGRVWVFAFTSRNEARSYVRKARAMTPNCIKFSTPMQMYQVGKPTGE